MKVSIQGINFWGSQPITKDTTTKQPIVNTSIIKITKSYYLYEIESDRFKRVQSRTEALNNQEAWYGVAKTNTKPQAELLLNPYYKSEDPFEKYNFGDNDVEMAGARYTHTRAEKSRFFYHLNLNHKDLLRVLATGVLLWLVYKFIYKA